MDTLPPLTVLHTEVRAHIPVTHEKWVATPFYAFRRMFSGLQLVYRVPTQKWFARLVYIGRYQDAGGADVDAFVEQETGRVFSKGAERDNFYISPFPQYVSELESNVALAEHASKLAPLVSMAGDGFVSPFIPNDDLAVFLVALPTALTVHQLHRGTQTLYMPHGDGKTWIAFTPVEDSEGHALETDGVLAQFEPLYGGYTQQPLLLIPPSNLARLLEDGKVYTGVNAFNTRTATSTQALPPGSPRVLCADVGSLAPGTSILLQLNAADAADAADAAVYECSFVAVGHDAVTGADVLVVHVASAATDTLHGVHCSAVHGIVVASEVAAAVSTRFASRKFGGDWSAKYPTAYAPTALAPKYLDEKTAAFHDLVKMRDCTRNAWKQRESTCWANAILNVITLTPTLRDAFVAAAIGDFLWDPVTRAARAIQDAIKCTSTKDAPFCAFAGPEMVCKLLRNSLIKGGHTEQQFIGLCNAAHIPLGDGVHGLEHRFQLVHVCTLTPRANTPVTRVPWDMEAHAAAAIVSRFDADGGGHAMAGVRCPTDYPPQPADYILVDGTHTHWEFNWLNAIEGKVFSMWNLSSALGHPRVEQVLIRVLFDLHTTFPKRETEP